MRHIYSTLAIALLLPSIPLGAQRLSGVAHPRHYTLQLSPNLQTATFTGTETIELNLDQAADSIVLNASQLTFGNVSADMHGNTLPAQVSLDPDLEQATFHFAQNLPPGPVTLKIAYSGILNQKLRGFYLSKTARRNYAVTQFEPTDARRAFPCFDEPAYKATFDISLVVGRQDTAIANTSIVSDRPGPFAGEHTLRFARTPKMSTYLVAFLVGDFQCLRGSSDGIPIRACATPDKVQYAHFALAGAQFFLHYYDTYFGIRYPLAKLDMIALPDFEAGAMENFGAITYRETAMLVNEKTASLDEKREVAVDVAHEMAHQWFGDLVTMAWWDNIWLNEGFATWMSHKPLAAWKPLWEIPQDQASQLNRTLDIDAGRATRPIRATRAETPGEINELFDGIAYGKAAAVLLMTENYLGEDQFRAGVHDYLQAHLYGNATAEDFWGSLQKSSGKPVDKVMESLVTQPGEPLLTFGSVRDASVPVTEKRFFLNPASANGEEQTWVLPVCFKTLTAKLDCPLLNAGMQRLPVPVSALFYGNAGGKGYYRTRYNSDTYQLLLRNVENGLTASERITFLGNQWALTQAGLASVGDYLNLAAAVRDDSSSFVLSTVATALHSIDQQVASTTEQREQIAAWLRTYFAPALARLDPPIAADPPGKALLRAKLFTLVGDTGADPQVIRQATQIADQFLREPGSVEPTLAAQALTIAAQNGDSALFDRLQKVSQTNGDPQIAHQALYALASFRDPALITRTLNYAISGQVRSQDALRLVQIELRERRTQDAAWQYLQQNWPGVQAQITTWMGASLIESTGNFCSAQRDQQITDFFSAHPVPASARALAKAHTSILDCVHLRAAQGPNLNQWLQTSAAAAH